MIRSVDMPLPVVALAVVIDILFPVALITAQVQFFRNTAEGVFPDRAALSLPGDPSQPSLTAVQRI